LAGGDNLYSYGLNPITWIDPWGWAVTPLNAPGYTVYGLYAEGVNPLDGGKPYYIGHTVQDVIAREGQHASTGRLGKGRLIPLERDLTYTQAKGYEQAYREHYNTKTGFPGNVIEPIDKSRTDARGKSHIREYKKAKKAISGACC